MDIIRAKESLEILADGVNPMTGEVLLGNDSCNHAEVVRALYAVLKHLDTNSDKPKKLQVENAGKTWTLEEVDILCRMYDTGCSARDMCNRLGRSKGAIAARLVRNASFTDRRCGGLSAGSLRGGISALSKDSQPVHWAKDKPEVIAKG